MDRGFVSTDPRAVVRYIHDDINVWPPSGDPVWRRVPVTADIFDTIVAVVIGRRLVHEVIGAS